MSDVVRDDCVLSGPTECNVEETVLLTINGISGQYLGRCEVICWPDTAEVELLRNVDGQRTFVSFKAHQSGDYLIILHPHTRGLPTCARHRIVVNDKPTVVSYEEIISPDVLPDDRPVVIVVYEDAAPRYEDACVMYDGAVLNYLNTALMCADIGRLYISANDCNREDLPIHIRNHIMRAINAGLPYVVIANRQTEIAAFPLPETPGRLLEKLETVLRPGTPPVL